MLHEKKLQSVLRFSTPTRSQSCVRWREAGRRCLSVYLASTLPTIWPRSRVGKAGKTSGGAAMKFSSMSMRRRLQNVNESEAQKAEVLASEKRKESACRKNIIFKFFTTNLLAFNFTIW